MAHWSGEALRLELCHGVSNHALSTRIQVYTLKFRTTVNGFVSELASKCRTWIEDYAYVAQLYIMLRCIILKINLVEH